MKVSFLTRSSFRRICATAVIALLMPCARADATGDGPVITVTPARALMDEPLRIRISGADPHGRVHVAATVKQGTSLLWSSAADFVANDHGIVDLTRQAPARGSYSGVHPMGIVWSMHQMTKTYEGLGAPGLSPIVYEFSATADDGKDAKAAVTRLRVADDVGCESIDKGQFVAFVCRPRDRRAHPAIVVLGGSEGGEQRRMASMFASHGFVAMALAYFGVESLPKLLREIPVENVGRGVSWLQAQPFVERGHIGVWGGSKGGELALLSASIYPQVHAVVSQYGSPMMWYGWRGSASQPPTSSWSVNGHPTPYIPYSPGSPRLVGIGAPQFIHIERIHGPVLFIAGNDDKEWPSAVMARLGMERLKLQHHPFSDELLVLPNAGHGFSAPYYPVEVLAPLGGTLYGNERASVQSWHAVLDFFTKNL